MEKKKSFFNSFIFDFLVAFLCCTLLFNFVLKPCQVDGTSMVPTLADGDKGYSFIITKKLGIKRFDICIIQATLEGKDRLLVKRCIGMPNETIEYKDNRLYINDEYVPEDFVKENSVTNDFKVELGEDEYYCLGDNRNVSRDSRFYGSFSSKDILATNFFAIYPFKNFGVKK